LAPFGHQGAATVFTTYYSSVALTECVAVPRCVDSGRLPAKTVLISVATLSQMYKGLDTLIDAVETCVSNGLNVFLVIVGDGQYQANLEARAAKAGLANRVRFTGRLPRELVTRELDTADIFVLASRCEGLPRSMIEAMARGLPCIGSDVGGIPELLAPRDIVPPGNVDSLASKIAEVAQNGELRAEMSKRNLEKAHQYLDEVLSVRRTAFYRHVRHTTGRWALEEA
jgi:glycosyltransferase involved in cell wall biosynthesis